jgi:large subunit ribosomal protein L9
MKQQYLLITDVEDIGKSGEVISVKHGFARNYLVPQQKAVQATPHTLRMQARLQAERAKQAEIDRKEAEELSAKLNGLTLQTVVKVDPEGNMYGSVGYADILELFAKEGLKLERRNIGINKPIKTIGVHPMTLKLKEGVVCPYTLEILGEQANPSKE